MGDLQPAPPPGRTPYAVVVGSPRGIHAVPEQGRPYGLTTLDGAAQVAHQPSSIAARKCAAIRMPHDILRTSILTGQGEIARTARAETWRVKSPRYPSAISRSRRAQPLRLRAAESGGAQRVCRGIGTCAAEVTGGIHLAPTCPGSRRALPRRVSQKSPSSFCRPGRHCPASLGLRSPWAGRSRESYQSPSACSTSSCNLPLGWVCLRSWSGWDREPGDQLAPFGDLVRIDGGHMAWMREPTRSSCNRPASQPGQLHRAEG